MARTIEHPTRTRHWAVTLLLATVALMALYTVLSIAFFSAYLIAGRHLLIGPDLDGRLTAASLPQVRAGWVPHMDTMQLADLPSWLRWLCATPTMISALLLIAATVLIVVAVRRLATGASGPALTRPWAILAMVLILGGAAQGAVDTAAIQVLREQHHPPIGSGGPLNTAAFAMPWPTIAGGLLAAALAAALRVRFGQHVTAPASHADRG